ncbi:MAG: sel1 repeat family protein, partial [Betaproteobacteria bacterium]|nr:sel1 repeat family protein [Betaproteobacteria bacterium]
MLALTANPLHFAGADSTTQISSENSTLNLLKQKARSGDANSQLHLAIVYRDGLHGEKNIKLAFHWFEQAAQSGDVSAQLRVANMLQKGLGTQTNQKAAYQWFSIAAENGNVDALIAKATMLQYG